MRQDETEKGLNAPLIDIRNVDVTLRGQRVLTDVSWQLKEGEHWAVMGANGAGKSTFLKLIRGDLWPDQGSRSRRTYYLTGTMQESPVGVKEGIAFISPEAQDAYVRNQWDLSGKEIINTGFFDSVWLHQEPDAEQKAYAERIIHLMKLEELGDKGILAMSEGEARKVLIARALVSRPRVLLLDEFSGGLDIPSRGKMLRLVERIAQSGTQVVCTTHRASELIPSISHILFLKEGKILCQGKREEVLTPENLPLAVGNVFFRVRGIRRKDVSVPVKTPRRNGSHLVKIRKADVYIEGKRILEGINWQIARDENWAVLGRNGAGKSTLLKLIRGDLHPAFGGEVRRFGGVKNADIRDMKKRIGYVSSELQANYDYPLTGEEVVLSGFFSSIGLYGEVTGDQKQIARRWMRFFRMEAYANKDVRSMSYGEFRKILMIRAMVNDPDILILDEPCSGLDIAARQEVLAILEKLSKTGTGIILVTHHLEDLIPSVSHVLLMDGGRIIARGKREAVLRKRELSALFGDTTAPVFG